MHCLFKGESLEINKNLTVVRDLRKSRINFFNFITFLIFFPTKYLHVGYWQSKQSFTVKQRRLFLRFVTWFPICIWLRLCSIWTLPRANCPAHIEWQYWTRQRSGLYERLQVFPFVSGYWRCFCRTQALPASWFYMPRRALTSTRLNFVSDQIIRPLLSTRSWTADFFGWFVSLWADWLLAPPVVSTWVATGLHIRWVFR